MNLLKDISSGENSPDIINVVIDIPKGSLNKYEYNEEGGYFILDRVNYSSIGWPFDYGSVPQTKADDGDPLDVVLLVGQPTFPGCVIKARPIGILFMEDEKGEDNKIIALPTEKIEPRLKEIQEMTDLPEHIKKEIEFFFEHYKKLEPGKFVKIKEWAGKEKAKEKIIQAVKNYGGGSSTIKP